MAIFENINNLSKKEMENAVILKETTQIKDGVVYVSKNKNSFYRYDNWTIDEFDWKWNYCNTKFA